MASMENKAAAHAVEVLSKKKRVFVRGIVRLDTYTRQEVVWANQISYMPFHDRGDGDLPFHRPELHAHTKMSGLDELGRCKELVEYCGWDASFRAGHYRPWRRAGIPVCFDANMALKKSGKDLKLIYGVEAYMANDMAAFTGEDEEIGEMVVFDIETTGAR